MSLSNIPTCLLAGVSAIPYSSNASSEGTCSAKMVTEIVVSTVVALTTTTDVQMLTTTVTDVQTYTTFGISTTTTVNFLTTTTTIMSTVAMTVQPECTEAKIVYCLLFTSYQSISVQYFPLSVFKLTLFENGHIVCMPALTC